MRRLRLPGMVAAATVSLAAALTAQTVPPIHFEEFTLDNGLRVIVHEDRSTPIVAVDMWYDVGAAHDPAGRSGFAHLFEHMLLQETENIPLGDLMQMVPAAGGDFNATVDNDRSSYYEVVPSNRLNLVLWMQAERMARLVVSDENFQREREVVKEERRLRYDNQPYTVGIAIVLDTLAIDWAPYKNPPIGSLEDLDAASLADVREFHRGFYHPGNATLVVAGDAGVGQVRALVEEYFASIPAGPAVGPLPAPTPTPRSDGERRVTVEDRLANIPLFAAAYTIPPHRHEDTYALQLLSAIFSMGESSRLNQRLVKEERAALVVQAGLDSRLGPGKMMFFALPNQGVPIERIEELVGEEIRRLIEHGVTEEELEKAKNQALAGHIRSRQTVFAKARQLHHYRFMHDDISEINTEMDRVMAVSAEEVREAARRYLAHENRAVVIIVPPTREAS